MTSLFLSSFSSLPSSSCLGPHRHAVATACAVVETSGKEGELHFPADSRARAPVRARGARAPGARSLPSASCPPEPLPWDEVGGARNHLATANRPMQHSLAPPPPAEAPAEHNAALRQHRGGGCSPTAAAAPAGAGRGRLRRTEGRRERELDQLPGHEELSVFSAAD